MEFALTPLPFEKDALSEFMSAETLEFHHGKHHRAYVDKVNGMLSEGKPGCPSLVEIVRAARQQGDRSLFNNSAQIWNHNFFWLCLAPASGQKPTGRLAEMIDQSFGSVEAMIRELKDEATRHFSNGWAWLVVDRGTLKITSLHDADTPLVHQWMKPLLTLDVWEHAYYVDYRNGRATYSDRVLGNIVNWDFVAENLDGQGESRADQQSN